MVGRPATAAAIPQVMALPMRIGAAAPAWLEPTTALVPGSGSLGSLGSALALAPASSGLDSGASPLDSRDHPDQFAAAMMMMAIRPGVMAPSHREPWRLPSHGR